MKGILITIFTSICLSYGLNAQDTLIKKNGDTLSISVIKLTDDALVYNKTSESKEKIFTTPFTKLELIIYADGTTYDFMTEDRIYESKVDSIEKIGYPLLEVDIGWWGPYVHSGDKTYRHNDLHQLYTQTERLGALKKYEYAANLKVIANVLSFPSGFAIGYALTNRRPAGSLLNDYLFLSGLGGAIISTAIFTQSQYLMKESIGPYNEAVRTQFGLTENGVGLSMTF